MPAPRILPALAALAPLASLAAAYSFNIVSTPRQCRNLEVDITGTGSPPYTLLIIPIGPTPLSNLKEVRLITNVPFNSSTSVSFQLKFPENSLELYAEKVQYRGLSAIAQCESLRYKLLGGLAVRR